MFNLAYGDYMVMLIVTPCHAEKFRSRTLNEPPHGRILDATHLAATPLLESVPWGQWGWAEIHPLGWDFSWKY